MQLNILIVGVLFPAIPLMMINFGNRYSLLAGLIRNLHDTVINETISTDDSARFFRQIASRAACDHHHRGDSGRPGQKRGRQWENGNIIIG